MPHLAHSLFTLALVAALSGCTGGDSTVGPADLGSSTERVLLHEMFTGSNCGPCFGADNILMSVLDERPGRFTLLSYQVGSDPYMSRESVDRRLYYLPGQGSYSIPYLHVDGANELHPTLGNDDQGYTAALFDEFGTPTSPLQIEVSHSISGQTIDFDVTITVLGDVPSEELLLHAAIIEGVTYNNLGINDQTEFHHVMKKMVPDDEGTPIGPLVLDEVLEFDLSWTFEGDYVTNTGPTNLVNHSNEHTVEEFEDLSVIVWVQDNLSWQIHQSAASATDKD
jgi:hypothetical protein